MEKTEKKWNLSSNKVELSKKQMNYLRGYAANFWYEAEECNEKSPSTLESLIKQQLLYPFPGDQYQLTDRGLAVVSIFEDRLTRTDDGQLEKSLQEIEAPVELPVPEDNTSKIRAAFREILMQIQFADPGHSWTSEELHKNLEEAILHHDVKWYDVFKSSVYDQRQDELQAIADERDWDDDEYLDEDQSDDGWVEDSEKA